MICWFKSKQIYMALSSAEEGYMAASIGSWEAIWIRKLLAGLFDQ
jgi:hypothetical protein